MTTPPTTVSGLFEWDDDGGVPTAYLKGAYVKSATATSLTQQTSDGSEETVALQVGGRVDDGRIDGRNIELLDVDDNVIATIILPADMGGISNLSWDGNSINYTDADGSPASLMLSTRSGLVVPTFTRYLGVSPDTAITADELEAGNTSTSNTIMAPTFSGQMHLCYAQPASGNDIDVIEYGTRSINWRDRWTKAESPVAIGGVDHSVWYTTRPVNGAVVSGRTFTIYADVELQITGGGGGPSGYPDIPGAAATVKRYVLQVATDGTASLIEDTEAGIPNISFVTAQPADTTGEDGALAYDTDSGEWYRKVGGAWQEEADNVVEAELAAALNAYRTRTAQDTITTATRALITAETTAREMADAAERTAREAADTALGTRIDNLPTGGGGDVTTAQFQQLEARVATEESKTEEIAVLEHTEWETLTDPTLGAFRILSFNSDAALSSVAFGVTATADQLGGSSPFYNAELRIPLASSQAKFRLRVGGATIDTDWSEGAPDATYRYFGEIGGIQLTDDAVVTIQRSTAVSETEYRGRVPTDPSDDAHPASKVYVDQGRAQLPQLADLLSDMHLTREPTWAAANAAQLELYQSSVTDRDLAALVARAGEFNPGIIEQAGTRLYARRHANVQPDHARFHTPNLDHPIVLLLNSSNFETIGTQGGWTYYGSKDVISDTAPAGTRWVSQVLPVVKHTEYRGQVPETPTADTDPASKGYVDDQIAGIDTSGGGGGEGGAGYYYNEDAAGIDGINLRLTPSSATSKILLFLNMQWSSVGSSNHDISILRGATTVATKRLNPDATGGTTDTFTIIWEDEPATTSQVAYTLSITNSGGVTINNTSLVAIDTNAAFGGGGGGGGGSVTTTGEAGGVEVVLARSAAGITAGNALTLPADYADYDALVGTAVLNNFTSGGITYTGAQWPFYIPIDTITNAAATSGASSEANNIAYAMILRDSPASAVLARATWDATARGLTNRSGLITWEYAALVKHSSLEVSGGGGQQGEGGGGGGSYSERTYWIYTDDAVTDAPAFAYSYSGGDFSNLSANPGTVVSEPDPTTYAGQALWVVVARGDSTGALAPRPAVRVTGFRIGYAVTEDDPDGTDPLVAAYNAATHRFYALRDGNNEFGPRLPISATRSLITIYDAETHWSGSAAYGLQRTDLDEIEALDIELLYKNADGSERRNSVHTVKPYQFGALPATWGSYTPTVSTAVHIIDRTNRRVTEMRPAAAETTSEDELDMWLGFVSDAANSREITHWIAGGRNGTYTNNVRIRMRAQYK